MCCFNCWSNYQYRDDFFFYKWSKKFKLFIFYYKKTKTRSLVCCFFAHLNLNPLAERSFLASSISLDLKIGFKSLRSCMKWVNRVWISVYFNQLTSCLIAIVECCYSVGYYEHRNDLNAASMAIISCHNLIKKIKLKSIQKLLRIRQPKLPATKIKKTKNSSFKVKN